MPDNVLSNVYFYNSRGGDRKYNADSMTEWLKPFFTTGVFNNGLYVSANNNMTVTVHPGYPNIGGKTTSKYAYATTTLDLEVASGTLNRIDNVVVRRDDVQRDIYLMIQTGGLAANPVPPPLVRENGIYDLKLAEVRVNRGTITITQANISDTRMNSDVCGWVMATVKEIDFTQITAQFNAFFAEYKAQILAEYNQYVDDTDNFFELYKGLVLQQYNAFLALLNTYRVDSKTAYEALLLWFEGFKVDITNDATELIESVRGILSGDIAGQLAAAILDLQGRVKVLEDKVLHGNLFTTKAWLNACYLGATYMSDDTEAEPPEEEAPAWFGNSYLGVAYLSNTI